MVTDLTQETRYLPDQYLTMIPINSRFPHHSPKFIGYQVAICHKFFTQIISYRVFTIFLPSGSAAVNA